MDQKALSILTQSSPFGLSRSFDELWTLGQTSVWFCLTNGKKHWQIYITTLKNPMNQFNSTLFKILVKLQLGFGREIYVTSLTNPCYNFYISCNNLDNSNHSIQHKQGEVAWTQHLCRPGSHQSSLNKRRNWRKDGQDNATIPSDLCPIKRSIFALLVQFQGRGNKTAERVLSISQRLM